MVKKYGVGGIPPLSADNKTHLGCKSLRISDLVRNINLIGIRNLLGYNPVPLSSFRLLCGSRSIQACLAVKDLSPHPCAITFLSSTKGSKSLRNLQNVNGPRKKNPFELYLERKTNFEEFLLGNLFQHFNRSFFPMNIRNFFLLLRTNKIRSRAQRAHFSDCTPDCANCGQREDLLHLFFTCPTISRFRDSCFIQYGLAPVTLADLFRLEFGLGKRERGMTILGAVWYTAFIFSCRGKRTSETALANITKAFFRFKNPERFAVCLH